MFPGGGYNTTPIYISRIEDRNGNVLVQFTPKREEVISEADAYIMTKMMQGVVDFEPEEPCAACMMCKARSLAKPERPMIMPMVGLLDTVRNCSLVVGGL